MASHREPVVITQDKEADPRYMPFESLRGKDFTSMVSVPMETDPGGLVGVLNVHTVERREFTERDVELLLVIGRLIAGALHQARLHRQLVARERAHENFVEQVIQAQELERRRLAGDIHDGISQRLVTLSYRLDAATQAVDDPEMMAEQLSKARELVDLTLQEARAAIGGLRPPVLDDLGLAGGLASLARSIPQIGIEVDLDDSRVPDHIEIALYRIAQECLQNVVKHAKATTARLTFVGRRATPPASKSSTTESVSTPSSIRWAATRWAATGCCRWPSAPRSSAAGSTSGRGPASGTAVTATIPLPRARESPLISASRGFCDCSRQKSPEWRRSVSIESASARDSSSEMPMSANTSALSVTVASSTVERPSSVICTSVVRPSVGCGIRSTSPSASSRRIACVTLVTWTCSRSDALVMGRAPAAAERQQPQQLVARKAQVVWPQRGLDAGQQDLVGPHHRCHRDHAVGDVAPAGALPIGARQRDRVALASGSRGHASSYRMRPAVAGQISVTPPPLPPTAPPWWSAGCRR